MPLLPLTHARSRVRWPRRTAVLGAAAVAATVLPAASSAGPREPAVTTQSPVRIAASTSALQDGAARVWRSDTGYAVGGRLVRSRHAISHTASPQLYRHARLGVRGYDIPVATPGTYFVDLFTSETRGAAPGERVWTVTAEGHRAVTYPVDVARLAGPDRAWHVVFAVPVLDGTLNIRLGRTAGVPLVSAVEVDFRDPGTVQRLLFRDDFNGKAGQSPNSLNWQFENGGGGFGNHELQSNTPRPSNASLDGRGHLFIIARKEWWTGADGRTRPYTSARIKTDQRFSFQYGTAIARIHIPHGRGLWPAFWALGDNIDSVGWPLCGEMDVMENLGSHSHVVYGTVHAARQGGGNWLAGDARRTPDPLSRDYHVYGMDWGPSAISMWLDGLPYMTVSTADVAPGDLWNFNHPFHLVLDLAVGGDWAGSPDSTTPFPATMAIDYVYVRAT